MNNIKGHDISKDPKWSIGFRGFFFVGDGYISTKAIKRKDLKKMRYIKEISKLDLEPILTLARSSDEFFNDMFAELIPSVLVQDDKTREFFLIPKSCYWW